MTKDTPENEDQRQINRREFMLKFSLGLAGLAAAVAAVPVFGALLAPLFETNKQTWRKLGSLENFPLGSTTLVKFENADPKSFSGDTAQSAAWVQHSDQGELKIFAANCTHLGCPVRWEQGAQLFMCPCHGGVYYKDGTVAAGPPPKPLTTYNNRVQGGELYLETGPIPLTSLKA